MRIDPPNNNTVRKAKEWKAQEAKTCRHELKKGALVIKCHSGVAANKIAWPTWMHLVPKHISLAWRHEQGFTLPALMERAHRG